MYENDANNSYYEQMNGTQSQDADYKKMHTSGAYGENSNGNAPQQKSGRPKSDFRRKLTRCVAYALAFGLVAGTAFQGSSIALNRLFGTTKKEVASADEQTDEKKDSLETTSVSSGSAKTISTIDVSKIVEGVMPSIVAITNMSETQIRTFFGYQNGESESAGSGIIVGDDDEHLYIATNNHVVEGADSLTVQFNDDTTASAEVQGKDETNDLAVVKVKKSDMEDGAIDNIKIAVLADTTDLSVGEGAIAIGNALGYGQSVTTGVISALDRLVSIVDETTGQTVSNRLIQTDAAINPGNSGGALLNVNGEVIGINSSKYSDTKVEGMGFAIPISTAKPIIEELIRTGKSTSQGAYLGVKGVDVTKRDAEAYNFPIGAYITQVTEESAAAEAGLSQGDVITKVDDTKIASFEELKTILSGHRAGDSVTLTYERRGENGEYKENTTTVKLGSYPAEESTEGQEQKDNDDKSNDQDDNSSGDDGSSFPENMLPYEFFQEFFGR